MRMREMTRNDENDEKWVKSERQQHKRFYDRVGSATRGQKNG